MCAMLEYAALDIAQTSIRFVVRYDDGAPIEGIVSINHAGGIRGIDGIEAFVASHGGGTEVEVALAWAFFEILNGRQVACPRQLEMPEHKR
jgi:hypothetical protein